MKDKKPNDIPYLLDFARNIGLTQQYISNEIKTNYSIVSDWANGKVRPRHYKETRMKIISVIATKIYGDVKEWEEYIDNCEE